MEGKEASGGGYIRRRVQRRRDGMTTMYGAKDGFERRSGDRLPPIKKI